MTTLSMLRLAASILVFAGLAANAEGKDEAPAPQPVAQPAAGATRLVDPDDVNRLQRVAGLQASPDGAWLSYTVTSADLAKDKEVVNLWKSSRDGQRHVQLTTAGDVMGVARWNRGGDLAFLAKRGDEAEQKKGAQLWLLDRQGGEARKLTDIRGGIEDFAWSPDGTQALLVVTDFDPTSDPEQLDGWKRKTRPPIVIDRLHFKQDRDGYLGPQQSHLQLLDVASGKVTILTTGEHSEVTPAWSPDGRQIAFFSNRAVNPDATEESSLFVMEARAGAMQRLLTTIVTDKESAPSWSPDSRTLAYLGGDALKYSAYQRFRLMTIPAAGGAPRVVSAGLDRAVHAPLIWSTDAVAVYCTVEDDRAAYAARIALADGKVDALTSGRRVVSDLAAGPDGTLAVLASTAKTLAEVHVLENGNLRAVSHINDALLAQLRLGATEDFTSISSDGTRVNGLVSKPPGYVAGQRYPTLLYIHGGPNGQDDHEYHPMRELLTANGYVVLQVNYRGSAGRGDAYQKAIFADWGNKEVKDLLGAVDWAVATGLADPNRLGLGGWSYGGILTDYTIASDNRFKAAVSGAGSANQTAMYGVDQYVVQYDQEVGAPWKQPALWMKLSYPFFKADRIHTPTLFLSGEKDFNVPTAGAEQMYQTLRSLGVPTRLVIYPDQFHGISNPSYRRDVEARYLDWFDRYLKPQAAASTAR